MTIANLATDEDLARLQKKRHKYNASATVVDGIRFDSRREAKRYVALAALVRAGRISDLQLQPRFPLHARSGKLLGEYRADFAYTLNGERRVEDVKGVRTPLYKWKARHAEADHGIVVREV